MQQTLAMNQAEQEIRQLCQRGLDSVTLRRRAMQQLGKVVPFDAYCCGTIDPGTLLITSEVSEGIPDHAFALAAENEYLIEDVYKFNQLARMDNRFGILSQGMAGAPAQSPRFRAVMAPVGFAHELRVAFVADQACWGGVTLFRHPDAADFTVAEGRFLARVATPLAEGLRMALVVDSAGVTINGSGPGLIVLGEKRRLQAMNQTAQAWLDELVEPGEAVHPEHLPAPIYEVATRAQALAQGNGARVVADHLQAHLRIRTRSGQWLTLHGSHMVKPQADPSAGTGETAIIMEVAPPSQIAQLLMLVYDLTPREREVLQLVLKGLVAKEMAVALQISVYTVQDFLKALFHKVGVHSRGELVAKVLGDHYFSQLGSR